MVFKVLTPLGPYTRAKVMLAVISEISYCIVGMAHFVKCKRALTHPLNTRHFDGFRHC